MHKTTEVKMCDVASPSDRCSIVHSREGVICCFDILGYKELLRHNKVDATIPRLLSCVRDSGKRADATTNALFHRSSLASRVAATWRIFSDTIVVMVPLHAQDDRIISSLLYSVFVSTVLHEAMMREGLDVRGALAVGECYVDEMCFAGGGFLDAYESAADLNLSAVAVSDTWLRYAHRVKTAFGDHFESLARWLRPYDQQGKQITLLPYAGRHTGETMNLPEIEEYIRDRFADHNKPLDDKTIAKIKNTAAYWSSQRDNCVNP